MFTTTVGELGPKLPIGFLKDKTLLKDFDVRPYVARVDRHLNLWREANEGKHVGYLVAKYVSMITAKVNAELWVLAPDGDSTPELEAQVHEWWNADVMYVYFWSRIRSLGEKAEVPYACLSGKCGSRGLLTFDLRTTEVTVVESAKELERSIPLLDGFMLRDKKTRVAKLRIQPIKFKAIVLPGSSLEGAESMGYNHLREAVIGVNDSKEHYPLSDDEIDEITKRDMLLVNKQAGLVSAGLKLRTTVECPKCSRPIVDALDWSFDSFFGSSVPLGDLLI
jgi:hypothetical protein